MCVSSLFQVADSRTSCRSCMPVGTTSMHLLRASIENDAFGELETEWRAQAIDSSESFEEFARPYVDHARSIASEEPSHPRYGIFLLRNGAGSYECLSHCNVAELPRTRGRTLRVNWVLLAPKYDYEDAPPEALAQIAAGLVKEVLRLSRGDILKEFQAEHIKIRFGGWADRRFFEGVAFTLSAFAELRDPCFRGNWFHVSVGQI